MKIMIHSNGPMVNTGYGRQTALLCRQFSNLGHEVAVSCYHGVTGSIQAWHDIPCYPAGKQPFGVDVLLPHADHFGADLILTLMDTWTLMPVVDHLAESLKLDGAPTLACWTPTDCFPLSRGDRIVLDRTGALPIAMSEHGIKNLYDAGFSHARYVPHSVDLDVYRPIDGARKAVRAEVGADEDQFLIGIVAANKDMTRKAWPEQFEAFGLFLRTCPDALLLVHSIASGHIGAGGYNLREMADQMGIGHAVRFTSDYAQMAGLIDDEDMALWYNGIDLLSNCSYGEGFGLPILEAQACGTPVVATDASAMRELTTHLVGGSRWWNPVHGSWWTRPDVAEIAAAYSAARSARSNGLQFPPHIVAEMATTYEVDYVANTGWRPVLDAVAAQRRPSPAAADDAEQIVRGLE